jgi:hypothetical protein
MVEWMGRKRILPASLGALLATGVAAMAGTVTGTSTVFTILPAYMWAGGADVADAVYSWRIYDVSVSNNYALSVLANTPVYQSRNSCDTNRLTFFSKGVSQDDYTVCLPQ